MSALHHCNYTLNPNLNCRNVERCVCSLITFYRNVLPVLIGSNMTVSKMMQLFRSVLLDIVICNAGMVLSFASTFVTSR